jgi:hypothetical protein
LKGAASGKPKPNSKDNENVRWKLMQYTISTLSFTKNFQQLSKIIEDKNVPQKEVAAS